MYQLEQDITYIQSTVHDLEEYLLSDVLYWPITAVAGKKLAAGSTQLTLGNVLLSMKRLEAAGALSSRALNEAAALAGPVNQVRKKWKSNWDKKADAEIRSRLKQWEHYLSEVANSQRGEHGDYSYNIRLRVMLELLLGDVDEPLAADQTYLAALDQRLRSITLQNEFLWDKSLQAGFPEKPFWFLYRKPGK